jgi:hypothetical protein
MSAFESVEKSNETNEVVEDFLEVDTKIPGQNFACMSFVSPEKMLKQKEVHFVAKFLEHLFNGDDQYTIDMKEKLSKGDTKIEYDVIKTFYEDWKYSRSDKLEQEFYEANDFHTSMRGLKIRGVYDTHKEATVRAQVLRRKDPSFNVFVGQVGYWLPWDPECEQIQEQEYQESMLNDLVKKYKENLDNRDDMYEQMKADQLKKAKEENKVRKMKLAEENIPVKPDNDEDKENIEKLRDIVDESDRLYYDHIKKVEEEKKMAKENDEVVIEEVKEGENIVQVNDISDSAPKEELNGFKSDNMENLESSDPWMQRKSDTDTNTDTKNETA